MRGRKSQRVGAAVVAFATVCTVAMVTNATVAYAQRGALFVSNFVNNDVSVYPRTVNGTVGPNKIITEGLNGPHQVVIHPVTRELIVASNANNAVRFYDADAASPTFGALKRSIAGASTGLLYPLGVAVDAVNDELFVSNDDHSGVGYSITVYDLKTLGTGGNVAPVRTIAGAATRLSSPAGIAVVGSEVFVVNYDGFGLNGRASIAVFARNANGNVAPVRTIEGLNTGLFLPQGIVSDGFGRIYVANSYFNQPTLPGAVLAFNAADSGNVAPFLTLAGDATALCHPIEIAFDDIAHELTVANGGGCRDAVTVYDLTKFPGAGTVNQAPVRRLATGASVAFNPIGVAVTQSSVFVSNYITNNISVYPRSVNGLVGPTRVLTDSLNGPHQITINAATKELIVANNPGQAIRFFNADVTSPNFGALTRSIVGPATGLLYPLGIAVDSVNNELFVSNDDHSGAGYSITVYSLSTLGAGGNVTPVRTITGSATRLSSPAGIAVVGNEIYVVNYDGFATNGGAAIAVYARDASGNVPPLRMIQGPSTRLNRPQGIAFDWSGRLYVANSAFNQPNVKGSILVFNTTDSGDAAPFLSLEGDATLLCHPISMALDTLAMEITVANGGGCSTAVTTYSLVSLPTAGASNLAPIRQLTGYGVEFNPIGVAVIPDEQKAFQPILVEATVPDGAPVAFNAGINTCLPASGSIFPLGATPVRCSSSDIFGTVNSMFWVTVQDTTPPAFAGVANLEAEAITSTEVNFDVTATDRGVGVAVTCSPASGSTFYVGTTTVNCVADPKFGGPGASASFTVTVTRKVAPLPGGACFIVDFREITYFNGSAVITSSDADIRARNGIAGAFNPALWPYRSAGGAGYTKSKGTLFRIYGFAASTFGSLVPNEDMPWITYPVQYDADANGYFIDLGGPQRVRVCPNQFQDYVLAGKKGNGHKDSSAMLPTSQQNVPGIMLARNQQIVKLPTRVKREMDSLGLVHGVYGRIDYMAVQQQGNGNAQFREFVNVQLSFPGDSMVDRLQHYAFGLLTAFNVNFESFAGCNYIDSAPGNDSVRLVDLWSPNKSTKQGYAVWQACGAREPVANQKQRENYDVAFNAIQILSTVNSGTDTVNVFFGAITPLSAADVKRKDLKIDWLDWDKADR